RREFATKGGETPPVCVPTLERGNEKVEGRGGICRRLPLFRRHSRRRHSLRSPPSFPRRRESKMREERRDV
ncbi:MAG: hypothetical protein HAW59_02375, partial [Betaproteobacteria bacterium]|nr:hypothetical protein [Betaproteobacteria bacterium]